MQALNLGIDSILYEEAVDLNSVLFLDACKYRLAALNDWWKGSCLKSEPVKPLCDALPHGFHAWWR